MMVPMSISNNHHHQPQTRQQHHPNMLKVVVQPPKPRLRQCAKMASWRGRRTVLLFMFLWAILFALYQLLAMNISLTMNYSQANDQYDRPPVDFMTYSNLPQEHHQQQQLLHPPPPPQNETAHSTNKNKVEKNQRDEDDGEEVVEKDDTAVSACLLVKDDNHYLIEWLAYHYVTLPLRRLIVAQDPRSKTSPSNILQRYNGRMNITQWNDDDFFPKLHRTILMSSASGVPTRIFKDNINVNNATTTTTTTTTNNLTISQQKNNKLVYLHRARQRHFFAKCMKQLQEENRTWIALIDTDEYIVPNNANLRNYYNDKDQSKGLVSRVWNYFYSTFKTTTTTTTTRNTENLQQQGPHHHHQQQQQTFQERRNSTTSLQLLQQARHHSMSTNNQKVHDMINSPCISLPRLLIGTKESTPEEMGSVMGTTTHTILSLLGFNVTDFITLRWRWHGGRDDNNNNIRATTLRPLKPQAAKALIDVSRVNSSYLNFIQVDVHRPIKAICSVENMWISTQDALLMVHHYIGTYSQWSFRDDPRTGAWGGGPANINSSHNDKTTPGATTTIKNDIYATTATRSRDRYEVYSRLDSETVDDAIHKWIYDLIEKEGMEETSKLLQGAGQVVLSGE